MMAAIEENGLATVRAVGASAVLNAIDGVIRGRQQLASQGEELIVRPGFATITGQKGDILTAIVLNCVIVQMSKTTSTGNTDPIIVQPGSDVPSISETVQTSMERYRCASVRAVGAGAVNQAIKGVIKSRQFLSGQGEDLIVRLGLIPVLGAKGDTVTVNVMNCSLF